MSVQENIVKLEIEIASGNPLSLKDKFFNSMARIYRIPGDHIASLDVARLVASILIVIGHVGPFYVSANYNENAILAPFIYAFYHVRRMGLPFFLMASGFLFGRSLEKGKALVPRYMKALKRLARIFLIWSVFYAIEPVANPHLRADFMTPDMFRHYYWHFHNLLQHPLLLLVGGTKYNLWFLPSLILSIGFITIATFLKKPRFLPWLAVVMYLLAQCLHQEPLKSMVDASKYFIHFRSYCAGFAFVVCGWWFSQQTSFSKKDALALFLVAFIVQVFQDVISWQFYHLRPDSFMSIGLLPAIFGVFILIMCYPNVGKNTIFQRAGKMTLGIYVMHPFIFNVLELLNRKFMSLNTIVRDITFPIVIAMICIYFTKVLLKNNLSKKIIN